MKALARCPYISVLRPPELGGRLLTQKGQDDRTIQYAIYQGPSPGDSETEGRQIRAFL